MTRSHRFLSVGYLAALADGVSASEAVAAASRGRRARLVYRVSGVPPVPGGAEGVAVYLLEVDDGKAAILPCRDAPAGGAGRADAAVSMSYEAAAAIDRGLLHSQDALVRGAVRVTGNLAVFMFVEPVLGAVAEVAGRICCTY